MVCGHRAGVIAGAVSGAVAGMIAGMIAGVSSCLRVVSVLTCDSGGSKRRRRSI